MPARVFLDWSAPFLPALTAWLLKDRQGPDACDLSDTAVIVPTSETGRRLRESLALATTGKGLFSPVVVTPEALIAWSLPPEANIAGRGEAIIAWASVLAGLPLDDWQDLFPVRPVSQDLAWAVQVAGDLIRLRRTLEEGGRTLQMAAADLGDSHPETARWTALARLESLAVERMAQAGWQDPVSMRLAAARAPRLPEGIRQVVMAGIPDSIRLARMALESLENANKASIVAVIHAPESFAGSFDRWGSPLPEVWERRVITLPEGNNSIRLSGRPDDAADVLLAELQSEPQGAVVLGSADPEVSAPLRRKAAAAGVAIFDPEGVPLGEHEVSWLIRCLTRLMVSGAWSAAGQLLRIPEVMQAAAPGRNPLKILQDWDRFQADRLPQTLAQAAPLSEHWAEETHQRNLKKDTSPDQLSKPFVPQLIVWFTTLMARFEELGLPDALAEFLETVYASRQFDGQDGRQPFLSALDAWQEAVETVEQGAAAFAPGMGTAAKLELAASLVRDIRLYPEHSGQAQALHGWLELPWQEARVLVVAGMNEGMAPDTLHGDAWLPDSVRPALDLKTNQTRLARDSFLLTSMIQSRAAGGRILLLAARTNAAGDPLKPSRLLLRCPEEELPWRALKLFPADAGSEDAEKSASAPSWHRAWQLSVPPPPENAAVFGRLSVTAFTDYLKCPFRFYLKHVLRMEPYDASQSELDARAFGSLFHDTMQDLHLNPGLRDSTDADAVKGFLLQALGERSALLFGPQLTLPVAVQMDTLKRSLAKAAELHAAERAAGWRFEQVEIDFPKLPGSDEPVRLLGVEIRGRIDLIERHPDKGLRILDYKTSSRAVTPAAAHLKKAGPKDGDPEWKFTELDGQSHAWQNLQLPLYAKFMSDHYGEPVAVGYVNLPRALGESRVEMWENLTDFHLGDALNCAMGVIAAIRALQFWPPAEKIRYDDFESLAFRGMQGSFAPLSLKRAEALAASGQFCFTGGEAAVPL